MLFRCEFRQDGDDAGSTQNRNLDLSGGFEPVEVFDPTTEVPTVVTGILSSVCEVQIVSEVTVTAGAPFHVLPLSDAVTDAITVNLNPLDTANLLHANWASAPVPEGLTLTGFEVEGALGNSLQAFVPFAVDADITTASIDISDAVSTESIFVSITAVLEDAEGNEVRSDPFFFPETTIDCCPGNHPLPRALPPRDGTRPSIGVNQAAGELYQVGSLGDEYTYFCNSGVYISCFSPPPGFSDPLNQRYQEIGGTALFLDDTTNAMVQFFCRLSDAGDSSTPFDPVFGQLSGRYMPFYITKTADDSDVVDDVASVMSSTEQLWIFVSAGLALIVVVLTLAIVSILRKQTFKPDVGEVYHKESEMYKASLYAQLVVDDDDVEA